MFSDEIAAEREKKQMTLEKQRRDRRIGDRRTG